MVGLLPLSQTTSPWNSSPRRTWQTHHLICSTCYCTSRAMITSSITAPVRKWPCLTHSLSSVHVLDLTSHWTLPSTMLACPHRGRKHSKSLCEEPWDACSCQHDHWLTWWHQGGPSPVMPKLATLQDPHHGRWPCPTWRSPHHPSVRMGEGPTTTPPVPSRNHQSPVVHIWMCLLGRHKQSHRRSSSVVWDLHPVPSPKCCSTHHSYANSIPPMADVCHGHLYLGRNWLPDMWQLLFKDDTCLMSSIWPEQHCQSCLIAQRNVLRAWNFWSILLWQWPSVCECTVYWVLHLLGYHTWDLKAPLPTIKWIHRGVHKICEACTPTC